MLNLSMMEDVKSFYKKSYLSLNDQASVIRGPFQISFDVTNRCMMQCLHCFNRSNEVARDELSKETINYVIDQIISVKPQQVCICGGEPLMRKKEVVKIMHRLLDNGIMPAMVSNGYLVDKEFAESISGIGPVSVQISLDGLNAGQHDRLRGKEGAFDRAVNAIKTLVEHKIPVMTSFAPTAFNIDSFQEYVDFTFSLGVIEIRVQPLMFLGNALYNVREVVPSSQQYEKLVRFIKNFNYQNATQIVMSEIASEGDPQVNMSKFRKVEWGDPVDHIVRFSKLVTKPTYSFGIHSTGDISVSPYFPLVVGNIMKHSLEEYWAAGLNKIWEYDLVQKIADQIRCVADMGNIKPLSFYEDSLKIDLVEDDETKIQKLVEDIFN